ncbi:MAG: hypothetical protein ABI614_10335, partial [Planctomycetota bacterium]
TISDSKKMLGRPQVSIRAVLLSVAAMGLVCAVYNHAAKVNKQRCAMTDELKKLGATVGTDESRIRWANRFQNNQAPWSSSFGHLLFGDSYCPNIKSVKFQHTSIDDIDRMLQVVSRCGAEQLMLINVEIVDADLVDISKLGTLRSLTLSGNSVTDSGLNSLAKLTNLQRLQLMEPGVTESGVRILRTKLPGCEITAVLE